jgi:hypothetical protein
MKALCPFKDIFGKPREGAHAYRVFNVAIVDVFATIVLGVLLAVLFGWNMVYTCIVLFVIGIVAHRLFCVRTRIDELLFSEYVLSAGFAGDS